MTYRLLIDYEAFKVLSGLKKSAQQLIHQMLRRIQELPSEWVDYEEKDSTGRPLHVSIVGEYAVTYWEDAVDRQVKVLEITRADS